jgi:hypothetical protein
MAFGNGHSAENGLRKWTLGGDCLGGGGTGVFQVVVLSGLVGRFRGTDLRCVPKKKTKKRKRKKLIWNATSGCKKWV